MAQGMESDEPARPSTADSTILAKGRVGRKRQVDVTVRRADDGGLKGSIAVAGVEGTFTATKQ